MNYLPKLDEVREFAKTGKYSVVPVSCEILSDFTTPIETMRILKNVSTHCYMLESAQADFDRMFSAEEQILPENHRKQLSCDG